MSRWAGIPARLLAVVLAAGLALSGCGGSSNHALVVSAAASLKRAFVLYGDTLRPRPRFSFAGSDLLAAQIEQGVRPGVFAAANMKLPQMLHARGLVETPVAFARNRLVLAVPAGSTRVRALTDLTHPGVSVVIGQAAVPVGSYTREVLGRLGAPGAAIVARARSQEADVSGIVGKLEQGAADAGFVYVTDVVATKGALRSIELPANLEPVVVYGAAVVRGSGQQVAARRFIAGLLAGAGRRALVGAGFAAVR